jgi:hypothetical protein
MLTIHVCNITIQGANIDDREQMIHTHIKDNIHLRERASAGVYRRFVPVHATYYCSTHSLRVLPLLLLLSHCSISQ